MKKMEEHSFFINKFIFIEKSNRPIQKLMRLQ